MSGFVLIHFDPEGGERRFDLEDGRSYRLGAKDDNDIVVDQQDVSRHHAILRVNGGAFHITDLKSKNGTFVNGNRADEAQFRAGDLLGLSSARMIIVEPSADDFSVDSGDLGLVQSGDTSNTIERRIKISVEDLVDLLEITGHAVRHGAVAEPLGWAGRVLGLKASLLLYCDHDRSVSIVSSAGDLGPLMTNSEALLDLVRHSCHKDRGSTRIKHCHEINEDLLVASVGHKHCLVVRSGGSAPAVGDVRALVASLEAVIGPDGIGGREKTPGVGVPLPRPGDVDSLDLETVLSMPLAEGRARFEGWFISNVLKECSGNQSRAARRLGVSRAGLFKKIKKLGLRE